MDTRQKYLNGDINFLENVDKIVPRRFELPLFMQTKIQIKKNLNGISSRLFRHMVSYDYKFRSLGAEPKQVIRALRIKAPIHSKKPLKITKIDRFPAESSSAWKLPPNVYHRRLGDFTKERKQMGKMGPYQCFTVERDDKTVRNHHHVPKPEDERCETDFYDLPSQLDDGMKPWNLYKNKFLKAERFAEIRLNTTPGPTKYFPQNFCIKSAVNVKGGGGSSARSKSKIIEVDPVFYYPHTTVPELEMKFNKPAISPDPGRYNPHNLTCRCHMKGTNDRNIFGINHDAGRRRGRNLNSLDFVAAEDEKEEEEGFEVKPARKQTVDDMSILKRTRIREPISFRPKLSKSCEDLSACVNREIRFNTMVKKKNLFSTKTGRPVAFLCAAPRFSQTAEKPIKLYEKSKRVTSQLNARAKKDVVDSKPKSRGVMKTRLDELATPKSSLPKCTTEKIQVFTKFPQPTIRHFADRFKVSEKVSAFSIYSFRKLRALAQKEKENETQEDEEEIVDDSQLSQIVISE